MTDNTHILNKYELHQNINYLCDKYSITNYSINSDGTIDVDGSVQLNAMELTELPLRFNKVSGSFSCGFNSITTLYGCPVYVGGSFVCAQNKLTSLEYFPTSVGDYIIYKNNPNLPPRLQSLIGISDTNEMIVFFKYYIHYDVYENGFLNEDNYELLIQDIKDGLK